jgi:hypothetical protein
VGDRPARVSRHQGHREVIEYHFTVTINVTAGVDEKLLRKLIDGEIRKLAATVTSKTP